MWMLRFLSLSLSCQHIDHLPFTIYHLLLLLLLCEQPKASVGCEREQHGEKQTQRGVRCWRSWNSLNKNLHVDGLRADNCSKFRTISNDQSK